MLLLMIITIYILYTFTRLNTKPDNLKRKTRNLIKIMSDY